MVLNWLCPAPAPVVCTKSIETGVDLELNQVSKEDES